MCVGLLSVTSSRADFIYYRAIVNNAEIIPPAAALGLPTSNAGGIFNLTLDTVAETFTASAKLNDMQGIYRPCFLPQGICPGAHLHPGALGAATPPHLFNTRDSDWTNDAGNQDPAAGNWTYSATNPFYQPQLLTSHCGTGHGKRVPQGPLGLYADRGNQGTTLFDPRTLRPGFLLIGGLWTIFLHKHLLRRWLKSA